MFVLFITACLFSPLLSYSQSDTNGNLSISQLNLPEAVAVDSSGKIFVADTGNNAVEIYDPSGNLIKSFGSLGSDKGQFENPDGIAVDNSGNIYVADENNNRIEEFDSQGNYIKSITLGLSSFQSNLPPIQITSATANVYGSNVTLSDNLNDNNPNAKIRTAVSWGDGTHNSSYSHSYNVPGTYQIKVVMTDNYGNADDIIQTVNIGSTQTSQSYQSIQLNPASPVINGFNVAINGNFNDPNQNSVMTSDYSWGDNSKDTQQATHLYVSAGIYRVEASVSDNYGNAASVFQTVVVGNPFGTDRPYHPKALTVDPYGNLYVGDSFNSQVYVISPSGDSTVVSNSTITHDPEGIALDSDGNIYITDQSLNRVDIFDPAGMLINTIQAPQIQGPQGITVDSSRNIYVANTGGNDILVFDQNGNLISSNIGRTGGGYLNSPEDIKVDIYGNIYVADTHNYKVIKIATSSGTPSESAQQQSQGTNNQEVPTQPSSSSSTANTQSILVYQIPSWIKNNAGWWANGQIGDADFIKGIQYLIQSGIIQIPPSTQSSPGTSQQIPSWIKNNAGWWANGQIGDADFIKGIQYLVSNNIIIIAPQQSQNLTSTSSTTSKCSSPTQQNPDAVSGGWYGPGWYYHPGFGETPSQALYYSDLAAFVVAQQQYGSQLVQQASVNHCST